MGAKSVPYFAVTNELSEGERLGISVSEINSIVHTFYSKVRNDSILGPIFADEMSEDWDHHLQKMCDFWTTVMFGTPLYKGDPLPAHIKISAIQPIHFDHWLMLFRESLVEVCDDAAHVDAFYARASRMAKVMQARIQSPRQNDRCVQP